MLAASSAATLRLPSSPKPGATIRRQHRHRHGGTGTDCGELACTRLGKRGGPRSLSAPQRSRPHKTDPTLRKGLGVDGISFAVHPRTVDEVPSTPGVGPGRLAAPSRSPPLVFLAGVVFHLPWLKVRSSIAFTVSTRWTPAARAVRWTAALASGRRGCAAGRAFDRRAEGCAAGVAAWTERARRRGPRQSGGMTHDHVSGGA